MEQVLGPIIAQGGLGVVAGLFFWLYMAERADHKETRKEVIAQLEARRLDAVEVRTDVTAVLGGMSDTLLRIGEKIEVGKEHDRYKR